MMMRFMMSGVGVRSGDAAVGCYDHIVGDVKHDVKGGAKVRVASVSTTNWVMRFTMSGAGLRPGDAAVSVTIIY